MTVSIQQYAFDAFSHAHPGGVIIHAIDALRGSGNPDTPPSAEKEEKP